MTRTLFGREVEGVNGTAATEGRLGQWKVVLKQVCDELGGTDDVGCVLCKG